MPQISKALKNENIQGQLLLFLYKNTPICCETVQNHLLEFPLLIFLGESRNYSQVIANTTPYLEFASKPHIKGQFNNKTVCEQLDN